MRRAANVLMMLAMVGILIQPSAQAATTYWWDTADGLWSAATSWSDSSSGGNNGNPGSGDSVVFNQTAVNGNENVQLDGPVTINGMTFSNTGTTTLASSSTTSQPLTLGTGGILVNSGAGAVTLGNATNAMPITLGGTQTWTNNSSNALSVVNALSLGANPLTINGSGATTISGLITGSTATGTVGLSIGGSAVVSLTNASNNFTGDIAVDGNGVLVYSQGTATTLSQLGVGSSTDYKRILLTNGGTFRVTTNDYNDNVPTSTNVAAGQVFNIGTGGGTFDVASGRIFTVDDGTTAITGTAFAGTPQQLQGSGTLTKVGTGTLILRNQYNFAGAIDVKEGTLKASGTGNTLGANTAGTTIRSGAAFDLAGIAVADTDEVTLFGNGLASSPAGALTNSTGTGTYAGKVTLGADASIGGANTINIGQNGNAAANTAILGGAFNLTKVGTGTLVLNNPNNTLGGAGKSIFITAGTLQIGYNASVAGNFGDAATTVVIGDATVGASATLLLSAGGKTGTYANPITVAGGAGTRTLSDTSGVFTFNGLLTLNKDLSILNTNTTSSTLTFGGGVTGTGNVTISSTGGTSPIVFSGATALNYTGNFTNATSTGTGSVTISAPLNIAGNVVQNSATSPLVLSGNNAYTGTTTISAGILDFQTTASMPGYPAPAAGKISVASGGSLVLGVGAASGQFTATDIGNILSGTLPVSLASGSSIGFDTSSAVGGSATVSNLTDPTGGASAGNSIGLTKFGSGTLVLAGTNTYTGNTVITNGILNGNLTSGNLRIDSILSATTGSATYAPTANFERALGTGANQIQLTNGNAGFTNLTGSPMQVAIGTIASPTALTWGTAGTTTFSPSVLVLNDTGATGAVNFLNAINLNGAVRTVSVVANSATLSGALSSASGGITKTGAGTLNVTNLTNSFTGATTVSGGILSFNGGGSASGSMPLPSASAITINAGGTLQILNDTAGTLNYGNVVNLQSTSGAITVGNNGGATTGSTVAFGALNSPTTATNTQTTTTFTGNNGYGVSFTGLNLPGGAGQTTTLIANTNVIINGAVVNRETGFALTNFDTIALQGTSTGSQINGVIADATNGSYYNATNGTSGLGGYTPVTKTGTGTWSLSGANTYSGITTVSAGTLQLVGSVAGVRVIDQSQVLVNTSTLGITSNVTIGNGTALNANGKATASTIQGTVTIGSTGAATLNMVDTSINTLTILGNAVTGVSTFLTLGGASTAATLNFETGTTSTDKIVVTPSSISGSGKMTLAAGGAVINLSALSGQSLNNGSYDLISYATGSTFTGIFSLGTYTAPAGKVFYLNNTATAEQLIVANEATKLFWGGGTSSVWNLSSNGATNWVDAFTGGVQAVLPSSGSNVFIASSTASAANFATMTLGQAYTINSVNFTGSGNAATNPVGIGGTFALTLTGASSYTDQNSNAVNAGTGLMVQNGVTATDTISAPIILGGNQSWVNAGQGTLSITGGITGSANLTIKNNSTGVTTIATGSVNNAGTVTNAGTGTGGTTISSVIGTNVTGVIQNGTSPLTLSGANTFTGGLNIMAGTVIANVSNATTVSGAAGPSSVAITLGNSAGGSASLLANSFTVSNPINLGTGAVGTLTVGNNGAATAAVFSGAINLNGGTLTLSSTGTGSTTISGGISGIGNLVANGSSTATTIISSVNPLYTGTTTVTAGTLLVQPTTATTTMTSLGSGTINLNGGTLSLKNNGTASNQLISTGNGTVGNNLNVSANSTLNVDRNSANGSNAYVFNNLTTNSQLSVTGANSYWAIVNGTTSITGPATFNPTTAPLVLAGKVDAGSNNFSVTGTNTTRMLNVASGVNANTMSGTISLNGGSLAAYAPAADSAVAGLTNSLGTATISFSGTNPVLRLAPNLTGGLNTAPTAGLLDKSYTGGLASLASTNFLGSTSAITTGTAGQNPTGSQIVNDINIGTQATATNSSHQYTGLINITTAGMYGMKIDTDDDGAMWIDGVPATTVSNGNATTLYYLTAGLHAFTTRWNNSGGNGRAIISYQGADTGNAMVVIPSTTYSHVASYAQLATNFGNNVSIAGGTNATIEAASNTTLGSLTVSGTGTGTTLNLLGTGDLTSVGFTSANLTADLGLVTPTANVSMNSLVGSGALAKSGFGTLTISNASAYTGAISLSAGGINLTGAIGSGGTGSTITIAGGTFTETGAGTIAGASSVIVNGGTLTLPSVNTYTGTTSVAAGTLSVATLNSVVGGTATSSIGAPTSVANGTIAMGANGAATLIYTGAGETTDRVIDLAGATNGATITQSGTGLLKFMGNVTATGAGSKTLTLQGSTAGTGEISGTISDNSGSNTTSVTKAGAGQWTLSNPANSFTGTTTVAGGTLTFVNGGIGTAGPIALTGGTLQWAPGNTQDITTKPDNSARAVTTATAASTLDTNGNDVTLANLIAGSASLTKGGTGTLYLQGANTFTGNVTINGGTLKVDNAGNLGNAGNDVFFSNTANSTLEFTGNASFGSGQFFRIGLTTESTIKVASGATVVIAGGNTGSATNGLQNGGGASTGTFVKSGPGTLQLSGSNSYFDATGGFVIREGILSIAGTSNQVLGDNNPAAVAVHLAGGTLSFDSDTSLNQAPTFLESNGTVISNKATAASAGVSHSLNALTVQGNYTLNVQAGANVASGTATITAGATTLNGAPTFNISNNGSGAITLFNITSAINNGANDITLTGDGNFTASGVIGSGAGGVVLGTTYTGTATLSGANTYTGATLVKNGTLKAGNVSAFAGSSAVVLGSATTNGTLDVNGTNTSLNDLRIDPASVANLQRVINNNATTGAVVFTGSGTSTFAGVIADGTGTTGVTVSGAGTLVLTNANTYTGSTTINTGTLSMSTTTLTGSTPIAINPGANGTARSLAALPGSGTLAIGHVGPNATGATLTLNPGNAATAPVAGSFTMVDNALGTANLLQEDNFVGNALTVGGASIAGYVAPTLNFDLGQAGTDVLKITKLVSVGTGGGVINFVPLSGLTSLTPGDYTFMQASGGLGTNFTLGTGTLTIGGVNYQLSLANSTSTAEVLTISELTGNTQAFWTGSQNSSWKTLTGGNLTNFATNTTGSVNIGALPDGNSNVTFTATTAANLNTTLDQDFVINSLNFSGTGTANTAGTTIASGVGGPFKLTINGAAVNGNVAGNGITVASGSGNNLISANVELAASQTWTVNGTSQLSVSGNITESSAGVALNKTGTGTLALSGNNSYTGGTTLATGTLVINSATAIGTGRLTLVNGTLDSTATFTNQTLTTNNPITVANNATINFTGTNSLNLGTGAVTMGVDATAGGFTIVNNATTGGSVLTFGGAVTSATGGTAGAKTITINGTGDTAFTGSITRGSASALTITTSIPGKLTLSGPASSITQLNMNGAASSIIDIGAGSLTLSNNGGYGFVALNGGTINATGGGTIVMGSNAGGTNFLDNGTGNGTTLTVNAKISGPNGFEIWNTSTSTGVTVLTADNTFAGDVTIDGGILSVSKVGNAGSTNSNLGAGTNINIANGTLTGGVLTSDFLRYTGTGETSNRVINLAGTTTAGGIEQAGTGNLKFTANFAIPGAGAKTFVLMGSTAGTGEIAGIIKDNSGTNTTGITKLGTGTWTLSGANTYTGATAVNGGTLILAGNIAGGAITVPGTTFTQTSTGTIGGNASLTVSAGGTATLGGVNTFTGATNIDGSALVIGASQNIGSLTFGAANASTNVSSIDMTNGSANFTTLLVQTNNTTANTITLGANKTLAFSGAATIGSTTNGNTTALNITGGANSTVTMAGGLVVGVVAAGGITSSLNVNGASLAVTGPVSIGYTTNVADLNSTVTVTGGSASFDLGASNVMNIGVHNSGTGVATGNGNFGMLDLSGASSVSITGTGTAALVMGSTNNTNAGTATTDQVVGTLKLSLTGTNTVSVPTITLGNNSNNGIGSPNFSGIIALGNAANNFSTDTIYVGRDKSIASGSIQSLISFAGTGGTLTLGGIATSKATVNIGFNDVSGTGTISSGKVDLTGGNFNGTLASLNVGYSNTTNAAGGGKGTFIMTGGTTTADAIVLAKTDNTTVANTTATFTLSGGSITINAGGTGMVSGTTTALSGPATVTLTGSGLLEMANTPITLNNAGSTFTLSGGTLSNLSTYSVAGSTNITNAGGVIQRNVAGTSTFGTVALGGTGTTPQVLASAGTISVGGSGITSTNANSMVRVEGGTLDLTTHTMAAGSLFFRSGTISNIAAGGATLNSTSNPLLVLRDTTANFAIALTGGPTASSSGDIRFENNTGGASGGAINSTLNLGGVTRVVNVDDSVAAAADLSISGVISNGGLSKSGAGRLVLSAANTYSGGTTLSAGTLVAANSTGSALGSGNLTLDGGTFASVTTGSISGNVLAGSAAHTIAPGGIGSIGALTVGGLTLSANSTLNFDITNNATLDALTTGALAAGGLVNIQVPTGLALNTYKLIGYGSTALTDATSFTLNGGSIPAGYSLNLNTSTKELDLIVGATGPINLTWAGGAGGWSSGGAGWLNGVNPANWSDANNAIIGSGTDTAGTITVSGTVKPTGMTFNAASTGNYTVTGGTIDLNATTMTVTANTAATINSTLANGSLTKAGTSTLTLTGTHTYSGATSVSAGTLQVGTPTTAGSIAASSGVTVASSASFVAGSNTTVKSLNLSASNANATILAGALRILTVGDGSSDAGLLDVSGTNSKLDLNSGAVVLNFNSAGVGTSLRDTIKNLIGTGKIMSSRAVAANLADPNTPVGIGYALGDYTSVGLPSDATSIVARYTLVGDANLDGVVDVGDLGTALAPNYGSPSGNYWQSGDFNGDGAVDTSDLALLAANYGKTLTLPGEPVGNLNLNFQQDLAQAFASVPEPGTISVLGLAALALLNRRNRSGRKAA